MTLIRDFLAEKFLVVTTVLAVFMNAALWMYLSFTITPQSSATPLHYNIYFGIDLLGPWWWIYFLPAAGLGITLVNCAASVLLCRRERFAAYFLTLASALVQLLLSIGGYLAVTRL